MTHPIVACAADIRASLKGVASVNPTFMSTDDKAVALGELVRAEAQLAELRLRVLADAGDLGDRDRGEGCGRVAGQETRTRFADARADLALATALDREHPVLAAAMREGDATLAQAQVIRRALTALPSSVDADTVAQAEAHLVAQAARVRSEGARPARASDPRRGRARDRRGSRGPSVGRARGQRRTADPVHDAPSGRRHHPDLRTTAGCGCHTARHLPRGVREPPQGPGRRCRRRGAPEIRSPGCPTRAGWAKRCASSWSPSTSRGSRSTAGTPRRSSSRSSLDSLRAELATADLIGAGLVPGDELTGDTLTAAQARRLACTAKLIPAVLGGDSIPLDLGRARRLFSPGQRKALLTPRHDLQGRRMRHPRHLGRGPPPRPLVNRRPDRPRQRHPALQPPSPPRPRHRLSPPTASPTATSGSTDADRPASSASGPVHDNRLGQSRLATQMGDRGSRRHLGPRRPPEPPATHQTSSGSR